MVRTRDRWPSQYAFILAAVGSAVGLGNVWRFPYLAGKYGGGAFLLPYLLILLAMGIPLLMMEFALGQKMQQGAIGSFKKIHPSLSGLGLAAVLCGFCVACYYAIIMAWTLLYSYFSIDLAWGENTKTFFFQSVLNASSSPETMGTFSIPTLIALAACWVMVYFCVWKGVESVSKVVAVTMPLPFFILIVLVIRGWFLEGAFEGISFYAIPRFDALFDPLVWNAALSQIFFSLSLGFGVMITYGSFRDEKSDISRSAYFTAFSDVFIAIFSGFAVFATIGFMVSSTGESIEKLAAQGPSLAFIVFPKILSMTPWANFFAFLFFLMLITFAIDSLFSLVEAVVVIVCDRFPELKRSSVSLIVCLIAFFGGAVFTTSAGIFYLDIVDHFVTSYAVVGTSLLQALAIGWYYGARRLRYEINHTSQWHIGMWWVYSIKYVVPISLFVLLMLSLYRDLSTPYEGYPQSVLYLFGWGVVAAIISISLFFSYYSYQTERAFVTVKKD